MRFTACVRIAAAMLAVACSRPDNAPAQSESTASPFAGSRDATVRAAAAALAAGRPWRATEIVDSASRDPARRTPEVALVSATAAAAWGGWSRVERDLGGASWLDSAFDGRGRELLARAALARGADSVAQLEAERAVRVARTDHDRGVREVLLARALDRRALGDSAAASYLRAAGHLPVLSDWLELRAAGATANPSSRQRRYARVTTPVARARIAPSEAQARERWRDYTGAASAYAEMGEKAQALRLRLMADPENASRARIRSEVFALLAGTPSATDARIAITLADSSLGPLSPDEELIVARAANGAGSLARAASGFVRAARGGLDARDRYAYAMVLSRLGRDADAAVEFGRVPADAPLGGSAAYQRAVSLLRSGKGAQARTALRRIPTAFPRGTNSAAQAMFLTADLATDDGQDRAARTGFLDLVKRYPTSGFAPAAAFHAGVIAYAAGSFDAAARLRVRRGAVSAQHRRDRRALLGWEIT